MNMWRLRAFGVSIFLGSVFALSPETVDIGTSANYAVLARTGISVVPDCSISGDVGLSPAFSTSLTGFNLTLDSSGQFATSSQVSGRVFAADYVDPTPGAVEKAVDDMGAAFVDGTSRLQPDFVELNGGGLGGHTLVPGLYNWTGGVGISSDVTLLGNATDTWIFQIFGAFTIDPNQSVLLSGGALAENVFWIVSGTSILGSGSHFEGILLCEAAITLITDTTVNGRLLSQNTVTIQGSMIFAPNATNTTGPPPPPPPPPSAPLGPGAVDLGTAAAYVILAETAVSTDPPSDITGDVGISPAAATFITGFSLVLDASGTFSTSAQVVGDLQAASYTSPTPDKLTTAIVDMEKAYTDATGRPDPDQSELGGGQIGGITLAPGLYAWSSDLVITDDVTLAGGANDTWIFQIAGTLSLQSNTHIILSGNAQPASIIWAVGDTASFATGSLFTGILLGQTSVAVDVGGTVVGGLLVQTAVTLQGATVAVS